MEHKKYGRLIVPVLFFHPLCRPVCFIVWKQ